MKTGTVGRSLARPQVPTLSGSHARSQPPTLAGSQARAQTLLLTGSQTRGQARPPVRFRRSGWVLYLVLVLIAALCLYLFAWPIARRVILHRGDEAMEETVSPSGRTSGADPDAP
ncbi:MAG: hypothetical protein GX442_20955 [Candidatus Riflebacteria bacterium]|nr:hypothetical protein [Candidatus Riflebacteria bacterium]